MKKTIFLTVTALIVAAMAQAQLVYDFNDGSWGEAVNERPESGTFTSTTTNGVKFNNAMLFQKEGKGQKRIILDKSSLKSSVEFPEFEPGKKEVILDAAAGTEGKTFILEVKTGGKWSAAGDPVELSKSKASYTAGIPEKATQIRIKNATTSALYIWKVTIQ
ncbi:MAG: hypothetical protein LBS07_00750 [Prevotellaceae bacterium]|jgi:hypothetical protein|nr:hypothetical protein [Prevotellaceae bacterium]